MEWTRRVRKRWVSLIATCFPSSRVNRNCFFHRWLVDDVKDFLPNADITYPLTKLEPYTQYAYYITAYTLSTEKTGAQSDISYFRTLPGKPHAVTKLKATPKSSSAIVSLIIRFKTIPFNIFIPQDLSWEPPRKVNGKLSHYILRVRMMEKNDQILDQRDYCLQRKKNIFPTLQSINQFSNPVQRSNRQSRFQRMKSDLPQNHPSLCLILMGIATVKVVLKLVKDL